MRTHLEMSQMTTLAKGSVFVTNGENDHALLLFSRSSPVAKMTVYEIESNRDIDDPCTTTDNHHDVMKRKRSTVQTVRETYRTLAEHT